MANKNKTIIINGFLCNPSLVDGPGYRTVLFLQGCNAKCPGCHNPSSWDINNGVKINIDDLANLIRKKCQNKKITISGGEPLLQEDALLLLFDKIKDFDICLYTGKNYEDISPNIKKYLKYIKVGKYIQKFRTTTMPYIGSSNQKFMEVFKDEQTEQK